MSATPTQMFSSGEFCRLIYDTIYAHENVSFYTNKSKLPNFELTLLSQMSDMISLFQI